MDLIIRDKKFYRRMLALALPVTFQMLINVGINIMDTLMLSRLGEAQISASSLAGQFINLVLHRLSGHRRRRGGYDRHVLGTQDLTSFKKVLTLMLRIALVIACVFTLASAFFPRTIFRIYTGEEAIVCEGLRYFKWMAWSFVFQGITQPLSAVLRTEEDADPADRQSGGFFLNIFVNWVFIFGNLGAPRLEIEGSAIGPWPPMCSRQLSSALCAFHRQGHPIPGPGSVPALCRPPAGVLQIRSSRHPQRHTAGTGHERHIGHRRPHRRSFVTASAITAVVQRLATVYGQGIYTAGSVIVGNTLGEQDPERAQREGVSSSSSRWPWAFSPPW
jgi:Na+-driven multidrug efflux pump